MHPLPLRKTSRKPRIGWEVEADSGRQVRWCQATAEQNRDCASGAKVAFTLFLLIPKYRIYAKAVRSLNLEFVYFFMTTIPCSHVKNMKHLTMNEDRGQEKQGVEQTLGRKGHRGQGSRDLSQVLLLSEDSATGSCKCTWIISPTLFRGCC